MEKQGIIKSDNISANTLLLAKNSVQTYIAVNAALTIKGAIIRPIKVLLNLTETLLAHRYVHRKIPISDNRHTIVEAVMDTIKSER